MDWLITGCGGVQLHGTPTVFIGPVKVKVPSIQKSFGMKMDTCADWVGVNVPLEGVKVTPARSLLADQLRLLTAPGAGNTVTVHIQPLPYVVVGQSLLAFKLVDGFTATIGG